MKKREYMYDIGGKTYVQRELVLGQINQLNKLLPDMKLPTDPTPLAIIATIGPWLPSALAIVLAEAGTSLRDKDLDALEAEIADHMDLATSMQVIEDFFVCNPLHSQRARIEQMVVTVATLTGSQNGASSSPEETSRGATQSSGDSPPESASRT